MDGLLVAPGKTQAGGPGSSRWQPASVFSLDDERIEQNLDVFVMGG